MIRIGTSGWTYQHWRGTFYPENLPQREWLEYYAEQFDTVELNASFYRIPKSGVSESWKRRTPDAFRFSVKMSRLITHVHRLEHCEEVMKWFFEALAPLSEKITAFLLQLPPSLCPEPPALRAFLEQLPPGSRYVFEFRNPDAYRGAIPEILSEHGAGFCIHDLTGLESPLLVTSNLVYVRFHGHRGRYAGSYPDELLYEWVKRIMVWTEQGRDVLCYFNNDIGGNAVHNAQTLRSFLEKNGLQG